MATSIVADEEKDINLPETRPGSIAVNNAAAPTFIGDSAQVHINLSKSTTVINVTATSGVYEVPLEALSEVQTRMNEIKEEEPLQTYNQGKFSKRKPRNCQAGSGVSQSPVQRIHPFQELEPTRTDNEDGVCGLDEPFLARNNLDKNESDENSDFNKVDEDIKKHPYTSRTLLKDLIETISQTNDTLKREKWIKRVYDLLEKISDAECFKKNPCGIYEAEITLRQIFTNPEKVLQFISIYASIHSVLLMNCAPSIPDDDSLQPLLSYLRALLSSPQFCACNKVRRDTKAVIKMLTRSAKSPNLEKRKTTKAKNSLGVIGVCKTYLERNSWCQHFLIITLLTMKVLSKKDKSALSFLLHAISCFTRKWRGRRQSYRWKLTLTIAESLTRIATMIPDLSMTAIVGDKTKSLPGLIKFFGILKHQRCKEIFGDHARSLVYIKNLNLRHSLLTEISIFSKLDVSCGRIVKDRINKSQPLQNLAVSDELHHGKNTVVMSGHFKKSQVVVKCYKISREQLTTKSTFKVFENSRFANELSILSYLTKKKTHSNIVQLIASDEEMPCLVLKYVSQGNLLKFLRDRLKKIKQLKQLQMIIQIADALVFLGKENVIHLGIRAENVLLDENFHVKLTGFQSSCKRDAPHRLTIEDDHVKWMDPEGLYGQPVSPAIDVWSLGAFMYEIFTYGCVPFNNPTSNSDHGDFGRKPMTASQAKGFVLRGGKLPKQSCIPESHFQLMNERCFVLRPKRSTAAELKKLLLEQHSKIKEDIESLKHSPQMSPPPELRFLKEDIKVGRENYNSWDDVKIENQDEDFPFVHLDVVDHVWNEEFSSNNDDLIRKNTYTIADPDENKAVLCCTRTHYRQGNYKSNLVIVEYNEFRHIKRAEKLRSLNHPSLVKILEINRFGPNKLEMISRSFPLGNVLSALLSTPSLRQHCRLYMIQIASAVIFLHDQGILHGCLRGENIFLASPEQVKVGRLGCSKKAQTNVDADYVDIDQLLYPNIADARWNPTEVAQTGFCSKESNCWSFGIVCWELSKASNSPTGTTKESILPYKDVKDDQVCSLIKLGNLLPNPDPTSTTLYNIYKDFWKREPNKRMSIFCGREKLENASIVRVNPLNEEACGYQQPHNGLANVENNNKAAPKLGAAYKPYGMVQESETTNHSGIEDYSLKSNQDTIPNEYGNSYLLEDSQSQTNLALEGGETKEQEERPENSNSGCEEVNVQYETVPDNLHNDQENINIIELNGGIESKVEFESDSSEDEEVNDDYETVPDNLRRGRGDKMKEDGGAESADSESYENVQDEEIYESIPEFIP